MKKYWSLKKIIQRKVELLLENPYQHCKSEPLHQKLKGLRSARITGNIRLIFAICEEVKGYAPIEIVETCRKLGGKSVVFITMDVHNKVY
ncbi:MAG: hypothetical protein HY800_08495 [Ignavibacteriales bacterium]|nr:hypothetical protein [Ignavibacteriales bacterium]